MYMQYQDVTTISAPWHADTPISVYAPTYTTGVHRVSIILMF